MKGLRIPRASFLFLLGLLGFDCLACGYKLSRYNLIVNDNSSYNKIIVCLHKIGVIFLYITSDIANRIKLRSKMQKISIKDMLAACDMNINAISEFGKGKQLSCISLAKIADYLDCSVDYLLGRTDDPQSHRGKD